MSFFGSEQKRGLHPTQAPGFGTVLDPFASISQNRDDEDEAYASAPNLPHARADALVKYRF